jgi:4-methyl-5(b-hydroxyethyl)-thiazole monophosphate biosynthesis
MSKAVIFFAPGAEECEGLICVDLLRRAGVQVQVCAVSDELTVTCSHGTRLVCDALAQDADLTADAVILPGGIPGTPNLAKSETVCSAVRAFYDAGKLVAAICAAPTVLGTLGLLEGRRATCYPGCEDGLGGAEYVDAETVRDGSIITGSGLGAAIPFALEIIAYLEGPDVAEMKRKSIVYRH